MKAEFEKILANLFSKKITSIIVVDISSELKLFNVELNGQPKITAIKTTVLPTDKKDEAIIESLRSFIKENNIHHNNAILSPALKSFLIKRLQLPAVPKQELPQTLRWQVKDEVSFDIAKAVLDYQVIQKNVKSDGSQVIDVTCVAAEYEEVKKQVLLLKQSGLTCHSVNTLPFGYARLIEKYINQQDSQAIGVLHLKEDACYIALFKNNKLDFYRDIPVTINRLKELLGGTLVTDAGKVQLTTLEIEEALFKQGIPVEGSANVKGMTAGQILGMLRPELERLAQEIKRSLAYYDAQFQGGTVKNILIAGKGAKIINLDKFLGSELSMDISNLSLEQKIGLSRGVNPDLLSENYAAFGLTFDYEAGVNLLPQEFRSEKIEKFQKVSLRWIIFIAALLLMVSFLLGKAAIAAYQKRLENSLYQLTILSEIKQIKVRIDAFNAFEAQIRGLESPLGAILKKISNIAPKELFFNTLSLDCETKLGSISGFVKGSGGNPDSILTQFISDMNSSGYFKNINISSVTKSFVQGQGVATYEVNFKLQ